MQLPKLTLVPPKIQSGALFPALELLMSSKALEEVKVCLSLKKNGRYIHHLFSKLDGLV